MARMSNFRRIFAGVLALASLAVLPAAANAAWLGFRNDLAVPVLIQAVSFNKDKQANLGKVSKLYPGEVSWEALVQPGPKLIMLADPKLPNRPLYRRVLNCTEDSFYSIQLDALARLQLVQTKMPKRPK
jgi:hypothetical protein